MNHDTHPALEQLAGFNDDPAAAEHAGLRRHLAACADCRQRLDQLAALCHTLQAAPPRSEMMDLPEDVLQAIEHGPLDEQQRRALHNDPAALKAALHYAAHAPAMHRHFAASEVSPAKTHTGTTRPAANRVQTSLLQRLLDWRPPAWGAIPLTAAAAFALALVVLPTIMSPPDSSQHQAGLIVASYADRPVLTLQKPAAGLPGMGFFHAAETREIPFDGLQLRYSRTNGLSANWAPVAAAQHYHLRLSRINADGQPLIAEADTDQPPANFPQLNPAPGRYQWLLTGQKTDGTRFRASGGFVVNDLPL